MTVVVRVVVALALIVGPATDEPAELAGWDAARFQEIAEREGSAWREHPVEYPPGSVVVFDAVAGGDVVDTHRRLVALSVVLDLGLALAIRRRVGRRQATTYLVLGLPLVPFGYQRLDTLVTTIAAAGALALLAGHRSGHDRDRRPGLGDGGPGRGPAPGSGVPLVSDGAAPLVSDGVAAVAIAAGAMVKVWPLVLLVGAVAIGRFRAALGAVALTAIVGLAWLAVTGDGVEPVDQVLSLRGATGWHVESLPGSLVALFGSSPAGLELNAYRIGTLEPGLVTVGRGLAVTVMGLLAVAGWRRTRELRTTSGHRLVFSLAVLGAVAILVVTAPVLSPQFLLWLTPWAALAARSDDGEAEREGSDVGQPRTERVVAVTFLATVATGVAQHGFGPAGVAATLPASLLTVRNLALIVLPVLCLAALRPSLRVAAAPPPGDRARPAGPRSTGP